MQASSAAVSQVRMPVAMIAIDRELLRFTVLTGTWRARLVLHSVDECRLCRYVRGMVLIEAAAWCIAGGLASGLVTLSADVAAARFKRPWRDNEDGVWGWGGTYDLNIDVPLRQPAESMRCYMSFRRR